MGRINDGLIAQVADLAQGIIEQACDLAFAVGIEVGASDVADEQDVAGKHGNGFLRIFGVEQCVGEMIECMARRLQYAEFELADAIAVALARRLRIDDFAIGVRAVQHLCPGHVGQDRCAGNEVLITMRLENMRDRQAFGAGLLDIDVAIAARIDHCRLPAGPDEIGQMG